MESLRPALLGDDAPGVVLLTGESGSGKTRLWRALADQAPPRRRFAVVEAAPAVDPLDFLNLAADAMGIDPAERLGAIRIALARTLRAEAAEGRAWILVVENAHHASPEVWGEVEALCGDDRWGRGFRSVLLVGRTELARRFASRPAETMAARVSNHLHLMPLDIDEAAQLPGADGLAPDELERLHRDSGGNLRRLLRLIDARRPRALGIAAKPPAPARLADHRSRTQSETRPEPEPAPRAQALRIDAEAAEPVPPPLVPSRPPIREEEGLIEVGWDGGLDLEEIEPVAMAEGEAFEAETDEPPADPPADEVVDDHYAALQAWSEWASNRDRTTPEVAAAEPEPEADEPDEDDGEANEADEPSSEPEADLRGEPPHDDHAPYGQLFSKLRQRG